MRLQNLSALTLISLVAVGCSAPTVPPPVPAARPIELPAPKIKPRPYRARVDRYSENVATRVEELSGREQTSITGQDERDQAIDAESDRLDPYRSRRENIERAGRGNERDDSTEVQESETPTAVMSLMIRAKVDMLAGRSDEAIDKLERGLRIQPSNPDLWHKLAEANLHGENYKQSISMARKSNRLTPKRNTSLLRKNWKLIAKASKEMGDMEGMKAAMRAESSI